LVLFGEEVASVCCYALHANVFAVCLAKEFDGFIVFSAELLIFTTLLLLASQLQCYEIFGQHVGLGLRVMFESAGGTIQKLLFLVDHT
jgi:hypothetical protein